MRFFLVACVFLSFFIGFSDALSVGRGIADVTGLATEAALYGYANPGQDARGLHSRQYSRAFVFDDGVKIAAFVVVETAMISQAVYRGVMEKLAPLYGDTFTEDNVMLSPTHSHSSPGGFHTFWMYQFVSLGFVNQTYDALVNGITKSISLAYDDLQESTVFINSGLLLDASANRSPYAYYNNPQEEIDQYGDQDTDKTMVLLKFQDSNGDDTGMISFFAVHTTSMKSYNHLVSSDNKGYAAQLMERDLNPGKRPGQATVLAAFTQTSEGDASPNTDGERCNGTDDFCSYNTSTCPEDPIDPGLCTGRGPAGEHFEDTKIIGQKQYEKAKELFDSAVNILDGPVDYIQRWVNMSDVPIIEGGIIKRTCRPAMGYSFAAGATDGPGIRPFTQGMLESLDIIDQIRDALFNMSDELVECHGAKPILLPTGEIPVPWPWQPEILPLQLLRIGDLVLIGVPAEVTTMSGRRLQNLVQQVLVQNGLPSSTQTLVISMANSFSSYLTTYEEYQMQRYEGASTTFGPNLLQAYLFEFQGLALALATEGSVDKGPNPPDLRGLQRDALGLMKIDLLPDDMDFGDVLEDVKDVYYPGDTVSVTFISGNPRNDIMTDRTFLEVQRRDPDSTDWVVDFIDADWETQFHWSTACFFEPQGRNCTLVGQESTVTITWDIPTDQPAESYRIVHYGYARRLGGIVTQYTGTSSIFSVEDPTRHRHR